MAFRSQDLSALTYANGFTLWHYRTTDAATDVDTAGYFNSAGCMLRVGDFILTNVGVGGTAGYGLVVVATNAGGVVDVANMTAFATVNTD